MRYVVAIIALLVLVGGLAAVKFTQISSLLAMGKQMEKSGPPPETVASAMANEQTWGGTISAVGTITSVRGVAISAEVPGVVQSVRFESGASVKRGQILVELDSTVDRAQLAAIEARKELATTNVGRTRALVEKASIAKAQLDTDESSLKTSTADLGALRAQIDRKTVRAPFTGRLGIRQVNVGQYLNPGTVLTELQAIDSVFVDFSLPQQLLNQVKVGMPVKVAIEGGDNLVGEGTVAAIDPTVDAATRSLKIRASVPNKEEKLRPGMFAKVSVVLPQTDAVVAIPAVAVVHASYGDSIFIVEDKKDAPVTTTSAEKPAAPAAGGDKAAGATAAGDGKPLKVARQQFVRTGESRGDFTAIADGLKAGQEVVTAGAFKLRNGASVIVNNEVALDPKLAPHPQNR